MFTRTTEPKPPTGHAAIPPYVVNAPQPQNHLVHSPVMPGRSRGNMPPSMLGSPFNFGWMDVVAPRIQRKMSVSAPNDPFEREADQVADRVMRMAEPGSIGSAPVAIRRKCDACAEEDKMLQGKGAPSLKADSEDAVEEAIRAASGAGQPLARETRAFFEPRFGHDFSRVRVHAGGEAASAARAIQAQAYTLGPHIAFASGQYAPETPHGKQLIAHELAHVVQQSGGAVHTASSLAPGASPSQGIARQAAPEEEEPEAGASAASPETAGATAEASAARPEMTEAVAEASAGAERPRQEGRGGMAVHSSARSPEEDPELRNPAPIPSNSLQCVAKWVYCRAPYSPGSWAARFSYHCPRLVLPFGIILPGTTQLAYAEIPDEFIGVSPTGRDMYRCRPRSSVNTRATIADTVAFALTRSTLYPSYSACHAGFRAFLRVALEAMFKPSGGGRPAGIRVMASYPGHGYPC